MGRMSPLPDGYRVVEVPEDRKQEFLEVDRLAFAFDSTPETDALVPLTLPWDRTMAVERPDGTFASVHASFPFRLPVPGATVDCSGLTWVGARPDQRRRGLLRSMIETHFARSLGRGEPVSALYAAEHGIYGRFGYGSASDNVRVSLGRGAALRPVQGSDELSVRFATVDRDLHTTLVDGLHRAAGQGRPGWITRDTEVLRIRALVDPPAWRNGGEPLRIATVHTADGEPRAYALLRRKEKWEAAGPRYTVDVREAVAIDAAAAHRLWSFVLDLDLTASVEGPMLPVDDPLLHLLVDARAVVPKVTDNVWVRILDLPAALTGRRYAAPVDVVLDVTDTLLPANSGRWRLRTGDGADGAWSATVERTEDDVDLALDVREVGAAYLGGRSIEALRRAGLVTEHRPRAALAAGAAFGWPVAPVCSWVF